ncbi:MAG: hypothetical protein ACYC3E_01195 [Carboxydocellales bacterium]
MKEIIFDPKILIRAPFWRCPNCGAEESFGVLMINDWNYIRRCRECWYDERYTLPPLKKKIIYIDQFAISNMMKILNRDTRANQAGSLDEFWLTLFKKLDRITKLQLAVCPDSTFHGDESVVSAFYDPLKRMYELLSHGLTFYDPCTIKRFQIHEHASNWLQGKENEPPILDVEKVIHGQIDAWQSRLLITVNSQASSGIVEQIRQARDSVHETLARIFEDWRTQQTKSFLDWFQEESMAFGPGCLREYGQYLVKYSKVMAGQVELSMENLTASLPAELVTSVINVCEQLDIEESEIPTKVNQYFNSPTLKDVPFIKITSMLLAALARKAAAGRKKPPNRGMANDINVLAVLLPYCDAMLIDTECHALMSERPLSEELDYNTRLYSLRNKEELLKYLDDIEESASKEHLDRVFEVYGEDWGKPFLTLYNK